MPKPTNTLEIYREAVRNQVEGKLSELSDFQKLALLMYEIYSQRSEKASDDKSDGKIPPITIEYLQETPELPSIYRGEPGLPKLQKALNRLSINCLIARCYDNSNMIGYSVTTKMLEITLGERANENA